MLIEFDEFGGVSGRPCSLAEMAIPAQAIFVRATNAALAIFVARRHATKQVACMNH